MAEILTLGQISAESLESQGKSLERLVEKEKISPALGEDLKVYMPKHPVYYILLVQSYGTLGDTIEVYYDGRYRVEKTGPIHRGEHKSPSIVFKNREACAEYIYALSILPHQKHATHTLSRNFIMKYDIPHPAGGWAAPEMKEWHDKMSQWYGEVFRATYSNSVYRLDEEEDPNYPDEPNTDPALKLENIEFCLKMQAEMFIQ